MIMFIHFFCLCLLSLAIKLNFNISKVAYSIEDKLEQKNFKNFGENKVDSPIYFLSLVIFLCIRVLAFSRPVTKIRLPSIVIFGGIKTANVL